MAPKAAGSATVRRVTFNSRVELRQYEISHGSQLSSNYGKRKTRASQRAAPTLSEEPSDNTHFDMHIALRTALELQRDVLGESSLTNGHPLLLMVIGSSSPRDLMVHHIMRFQDLPTGFAFPALLGRERLAMPMPPAPTVLLGSWIPEPLSMRFRVIRLSRKAQRHSGSAE